MLQKQSREETIEIQGFVKFDKQTKALLFRKNFAFSQFCAIKLFLLYVAYSGNRKQILWIGDKT